MTRRAAVLACILAIATAPGARAQGLFDFLGGGASQQRAAPPAPARDAPRAPEKKRADAKAKKPVAKAAKPGEPSKAAAPGGEAPPPPYEAQLMRLTEALGALAFLRDLCGDGDGEDWRGKMSALLDAEAPAGPRREKLIASFNRGFRGFETSYRACTPNAKAAIARYLDEASRLTRDIAYRYGSP
jgi:uncharacterized protein (TIGR02301 family)